MITGTCTELGGQHLAAEPTACEVRIDNACPVRGSLQVSGDAMSQPDDCAVIVLVDGRLEWVSREMYQYLQLEAAERGATLEQVLAEDLRAEEELKTLVLPRDRLEKAARRDYSHHPWLQHGDEECPF